MSTDIGEECVGETNARRYGLLGDVVWQERDRERVDGTEGLHQRSQRGI